MLLFVDVVKDVLFEHCTGTAVILHAEMLICSPERAELQHHCIIDGARHSRLRLSHYDQEMYLFKAFNVLMSKFFRRVKRIQTYLSAGYQLCFGTCQRSPERSVCCRSNSKAKQHQILPRLLPSQFTNLEQQVAYILFRNKSLFIRDWWEIACIWSVVHFLYMNHRTFCEKCNFQCDYKLNHKVLNCTPKAFALLVRNAVPNVTEALHLPSLKWTGFEQFSKQINTNFY